MRTVFLTAALVAAWLSLSSPAHAQITLGLGFKPSVAIDAATGTAYIAWYGPETGSTSLRFCRLPRGAGACQGAGIVVAGSDATGTSLSRPFVTVSGSTVRIVQHRYGFTAGAFARVVMFTSADGGDTWDGGVSIGSATPGAFDEATFGPGATISAVSDNSGDFQNLPLAAGAAPPPPSALFPARPYGGGVATTAGGLVAISADGSGDTAFRVYNGGAINDPASWTAPVSIGYTEYARLAEAPNGPYLLAGDINDVMFIRRWNGIGFDAPVTIGPGDSSESHLYVDAGGRLHAVWPRLDAQGYHLQHSVSDDGVSWSSGSVLVQPSEQESYLRVAAAGDHVGLAVWSAGAGELRAVSVGPGAPVTAPVPTPTPPPAAPAPTYLKTVVVRPVSGKVRVRQKGSSRFVDVTGIDDVPLGATIDVKQGRIELSSAPSPTGAAEKVLLDGGWFRVNQTKASTDFTLNEPLASCKRKARVADVSGVGGSTGSTGASGAAAAKKPKSRKLWGNGKGKFRTKGQYSAATIRGTKWLVQDFCSGTLTRVTEGSVRVRDNVRKKTIVLRKGKRYTARPKR